MDMQAPEDPKNPPKVVNWSPVELEAIQFGQLALIFLAMCCFAHCRNFLRPTH